MGVDMRVTVGVGFVIPQDILDKYLEVSDPYDEGESEVLERDLKNYQGLTYVPSGSYYDNEPIIYSISVDRVTREIAERATGEGGLYQIKEPSITNKEWIELDRFATDIGLESYPVSPFVSVLWS